MFCSAVIVFGIIPCIAAWGCDLFQATYQAMKILSTTAPPPFSDVVTQLDSQGTVMTGFFALYVRTNCALNLLCSARVAAWLGILHHECGV